MNEATDSVIGPYTGQLAEACSYPEFQAALRDLPALLSAPEHQVLNDVRNRTVCVPLPANAPHPLMVAVKSFARPSLTRSRIYQRTGSKARRSWRIARFLEQHGVGTPRPLGFLDRWEGEQLVESYFLTEFQPAAVEVRHELIRLFSGQPQIEAGTRLLQLIAREVRALHAAGLQHNDLGHQNILVRRTATGWEHAQFIDLNRARIRESLSARQRAADIARLWLPRSVRPLFFADYFSGQATPSGFYFWERWSRTTAALHATTRDLRHPLRARQRRERNQQRPHYPAADAL